MPNWCSANVELTATEREIKRLKKAIKAGNKPGAEQGLLNAMVPQPKFEGDQDWYEWNVSNWGTKWELSHVEITDESATSLSLVFETAWGPATTAFEKWADGGEGEFTYTYKYWEPGMGFLGEATHDGTCSFDDYVDTSTDNERYRQIAQDEWGEDFSWEEEEENDELLEDDEQPIVNDDLLAALEELKSEFESLAQQSDPEYQYLKEDIDTLTRRVQDYRARKESETFTGENDE